VDRRPPVRVAEACADILASVIAQRTGNDNALFARYAQRHLRRALAPLAVMATTRYARSMKPAQVIGSLETARRLGRYTWSGKSRPTPLTSAPHTSGEGLVSALHVAELNVPPAAADPLLDYLAARLAGSV
jgi:hypothetical protein